jgi:hypothetical protein
MVINRGALAEMIAEEVRRRLRDLAEAEGDRPRKPRTASADEEDQPSGEGPIGSKPPGSPSVDRVGPDGSDPEDDPEGPAVDGDRPDPEATADEDEEEAVDSDGDSGEEPSGAVNNEVSGKTVQAITIDPKSKVLPGAKEVVITFRESSDSLRVLITATGVPKFFWRGQLHDLP